MAIELVKEYFKQYGMEGRIVEFEESSATVELAAKAAGCEVEICGEAAADTSFIPVLIGMGIKNFSVSSASILKVRKAISECDYKEAIDITRQVISLETEAEIKAYLQHE